MVPLNARKLSEKLRWTLKQLFLVANGESAFCTSLHFQGFHPLVFFGGASLPQ